MRIGFSLIELIIVILIIGIVSFLTIKLPSSLNHQKLTIENLRETLSPNGTLYVLKNREFLTKDKNISTHLFSKDIEVYKFNGNDFVKVDFGYLNNDKILFKYRVINGVGDSFIVKNKNFYYVFKPFFIKKCNSFEEAKKEFLLLNYMPQIDKIY